MSKGKWKRSLREIKKELEEIDLYAFAMKPDKLTWNWKIINNKIVMESLK